ncbi:alpha/beta hydrolase [Mangrovimicrobium sediminis]|uniref:Alpha/beta hydrolase n=1 Tax=Mangrovimicrobium sediminis TaxID=2562682 RepID=A0A4Z0LW04_9GAMM|nr:alpha/beta hydrolase [Haliea sp. SAOS-164]TGD71326.1 alpha/beta hydrolase [Haliea sp. SAOS-164]
MPTIEIDGINIAYELHGKEGDPAIALTPGGRFNKESPGLPELADALAAGGRRVLRWDRPNCGASDICFDAESESELHGRTLTKLIRALDLGPTTLAAGSAGSRVSLIAASRDPEIVSKLAVWWISGGTLGLISLAYYYCCDYGIAASHAGMEAVAAMPGFAEQIERNPRNRDIILAQDPQKFIETMERWATFYLPREDSPVPGMSPEDFTKLTMPVRIYRNGVSDLSHPRATSDWVQKLIPHSEYVEAPWADTEWNDRCAAQLKDGSPLFINWVKLAPSLLEFTAG